jgi:multidrug efflux pump subunit AcrA (membrane-fusion protein)
MADIPRRTICCREPNEACKLGERMVEASPRFRQDLDASPTEADGVPCVDVSDPRTGINFRLYDFEYQLALQLNGQPLAAVTAWAAETFGVDLTTDGVSEFAGRLRELGFLETVPAPRAPLPPLVRSVGPSTPAFGVPQTELGNDAAESGENMSEWMSTQGAQTAQFVPDPALFDSSPPDLTPVAPELPSLVGETRPSPAVSAPKRPNTPPFPTLALTDKAAPSPPAPAPQFPPLPSPPPRAPATSLPTPAPEPAAPPPARAVAMTRPAEAPTVPAIPSRVLGEMRPDAGKGWAADVDGLDGHPAASAPETAPETAAPPVVPSVSGTLPYRGTPAPPGLTERRQPPPPETVVMSGFTEEPPKAPVPQAPKTSARALGIVLLVVLAGVIGYFVWRNQQAKAIQPVGVRVLTPAPSAVYRWFPGHGEVTDYETRTVAFETSGRLAELLPPGTEVAAGELLGKLQGAAEVETLLAHNRSRVAFYQQLRESMRAAGNRPELRQAELRLAEKRRLVDETQAALARLTLRASEPGELVETLAKVGATVAAGRPIARVKGRALHGSFKLASAGGEAAPAFCRVEVIGLGPRASNAELRRAETVATDSQSPEAQSGPRFIDCAYDGQRDEGAGARGKVRISLPGDVGLVPGQPLRLASRRFDAVFPVPLEAVLGDGDEAAVWVATPAGTAARRAVVVAARDGQALISAGLRVGDQVIVDPPAGLSPGAPIVRLP